MSKIFVLIFLSISILSCKSKEQAIVDRAIELHGGKDFQEIHVKFTFRGIDYDFLRNHGKFTYQREQKDSLGNLTKDILTNDGFKRFLNENPVNTADTMAIKYANSINSVAYFFLLPLGLNDPAVNKAYVKEVEIKGKNYHQIKAWFDEEGGGVDHQDVYQFWFNTETGHMDYLAYSYETDGGGVRFREAINTKKYGPFLFQDYNNYGYEDQDYPLDNLPADFENGKLPFLSRIENENISLVP